MKIIRKLWPRTPRFLALFGAAFFGTRHVRSSREARLTLAAFVAGLLLLAGTTLWASYRKPDSGPALASAMEYLPPSAAPFQRALDVVWRRELAMARRVDPKWTEHLSPRVPPALCPAAGVTDERLRELVVATDAALRAPGEDRDRARDALAALDSALPTRNAPLAGFYQNYNLARGYLLLGAPGTAEPLLEPYFANDSANPLREWPRGNTAQPVLLFHARMLAALAALPRRDSLAVTHFRGAVRMLTVLAPPSRIAVSSGSQTPFPVDLEGSRCAGTTDEERSGSMETWTGLVAAYRLAHNYRNTEDLSWELSQAGNDDPTDPLYPVLRHAQRVASGARSSIPESYFWAASNLRSVFASAPFGVDPRLKSARAVLLLDFVDNPGWLAEVRMERCQVLDRLARELAAGTRRTPESETFADTMLATLAIHVHARLRSCRESPGVNDGLRSQWVRRGARLLGDTVAMHAEAWRLALHGGGNAPAYEEVVENVTRAEEMERRLRPWLSMGSDTTHRFLRRWRRALLAEVADTLRARCAEDLVEVGELNRLPQVMLRLSLVARGRPELTYRPRDLRPVARDGLPLTHRARYFAGNQPWAPLVLTVVAVIALLVAGVRHYLWTWRRRLLVETRFYQKELRENREDEAEGA